MNIIISATLLITSALGQAAPGTTYMHTGSMTGGMNTGSTVMSTPPHAVDWITVSANGVYPNAYPLDMCVQNNLVTGTYVKYTCSASGSILYKDVYSSSSCSGNYSTTMWYNGTSEPGLINSFYCSSTTAYYFAISGSSCSGNSATIYVVPNICFYNSADNDTVTESYFWACGGATSSTSVSLKIYDSKVLNRCAANANTTTTISGCTTITGLGSLSLNIAMKECPATSSANIITIGIMWLLASFFAIVLV